MAFKPKTLKRIQQAIKLFRAFLKFRSVGPHSLSKQDLKELVRAGLVDNKSALPAVAKAYLKTHEGMASTSSAPKQVRDAAIDFLERMFSRYADKAGESFSTDIMATLEANLMPFKDRETGKYVYELLKDRKNHFKNLGHALADKVDDWENRWSLIVNTELSRASNYGAMDAIVQNNKEKEHSEIYCYKTGAGAHDPSTCDECKRFWYLEDGVTPRVYRLSELMANGSNIGRKRADWQPSIDSTHPNCRHLLYEMYPGWGFSGGKLTYISKEHSEYHKQRR